MNYWWVNQKQTYRHEVSGGYIWSPKRNKVGGSNRAYEAMRTVVPGDIIFSFADAHIKAIGVVSSFCYEFPKPTEFGNAGLNWGVAGWRVDVNYKEILQPVKPKDHIQVLNPLLPPKYSPLQSNGNGNQVYYLYDISEELATQLAQLMGRTELDLVRGNNVMETTTQDMILENIAGWEDEIEKKIELDTAISPTMVKTLIQSRRGQGKFRTELLKLERECRVTKVRNKEHLIASHTKPWRDSNNEERLDAENGFMLTPTIDHLFDRGFISFDSDSSLIISNVAHMESIGRMGITGEKVIKLGSFTQGQRKYLDWHREHILLGS